MTGSVVVVVESWFWMTGEMHGVDERREFMAINSACMVPL